MEEARRSRPRFGLHRACGRRGRTRTTETRGGTEPKLTTPRGSCTVRTPPDNEAYHERHLAGADPPGWFPSSRVPIRIATSQCGDSGIPEPASGDRRHVPDQAGRVPSSLQDTGIVHHSVVSPAALTRVSGTEHRAPQQPSLETRGHSVPTARSYGRPAIAKAPWSLRPRGYPRTKVEERRCSSADHLAGSEPACAPRSAGWGTAFSLENSRIDEE
jgi:hypothetical protein